MKVEWDINTVSKEKIHIDDLFKPLKGYQYPVENGFSEVNDQLHDATWQEKFAEYEHAVSDIPAFNDLPMAKSDKGLGLGAAGKYALMLGLLLVLSLGAYLIYDYKSESPIQAQVNAPNTTEERKGFNSISDQNTLELTESSLNNNNNTSPNEQTKSIEAAPTPNGIIDDLQRTQSKNRSKNRSKTPNTYAFDARNSKKSASIKESGKLDSSKEIDNHTNPKKDNHKNNFENDLAQKENFKTALNPRTDGLKTNNRPFPDPTENESKYTLEKTGGVEKTPTQFFEEHLNLKQRKLFSIQGLTTDFSNSNLKKHQPVKLPKASISFYGELGLGLLKSKAPFAAASPQNGLSYHAHLGMQYKRFSLYSGLEKSNFKYRTTLRRLEIYDSFPDRNMAGDTTGWFKKNFRDTTINQTNTSRITINTIPLHFQFKVFQLKKFNFQLGTGININVFSIQSLWANDDNGYLIDYANAGANLNANTSKMNLGLSLMTRWGYQITPLTEVYGRLNVRGTGNILNSTTTSVKPEGSQLEFGIRYHLK